jgi:glycosyltransferase involved in cell wall biosynthesis
MISVADAMTDEAVAAGLGPREKFTTIYSGFDVDPFLNPSRDRLDVRRELGFRDEDIIVAKVARLFAFKGHDDLIEAAMVLGPRWPMLRFMLVGGGEWRERLEAKVRKAGLADHFVFTGLVPPTRVPELLHAADLVAHASYREGLARVLPQALIAGRAVVSYDIGGAREVVIPGQTGELVDPGDLVGLASALDRLIAAPELRRRYGEAGRALCADQFRHEQMTEAIRREYEAILART